MKSNIYKSVDLLLAESVHFLLVSMSSAYMTFCICTQPSVVSNQPQSNFLNHPVEMCPLDDNTDTNMAAKTCTALFEVSGLMYSK